MGSTSGRWSVNIRNMWAVHSPMPLTAVSSRITSPSGRSSSRSSSISPASTCSASDRRYVTFARENPHATRSASGSSARICSGVGVWPPKRSSSRPQIEAAALTESCCPVIERTSAA